jgi:hypothetical protein
LYLFASQLVRRLEDGMPRLIPVGGGNCSPPSKPREKDHASCRRTIKTNFYVKNLFEELRHAQNFGWVGEDEGCVYFGSENDVATSVKKFIQSIVKPLGIEVRVCSEMGIKDIRPDKLILTKNSLLIGVVEIKKPGRDILKNANVLGELFDQMKLLQLFYGMGPVLGILTTGVEFLFCWFPEDDAVFSSAPAACAYPITTPVPERLLDSNQSDSPPGNTPSQVNDTVYGVGDDEDDNDIDAVVEELAQERLLFCTNVLNASGEDTTQLINTLSTVLLRMTHARPHYYESMEHHYLIRFYKGEDKKISWRDFNDISTINFAKFPRRNVKTLLAVEDLGRGSNGKAWLVTTETLSSVCVLKFHNENQRHILKQEKYFWDKIYPQFSEKTRVEEWSGAHALVMPRFATIQEKRRPEFKIKITALLNDIHNLGLWHDDVHWRNTGCYTSGVERMPVLFDLVHVDILETPISDRWIAKSLVNLFGTTTFDSSQDLPSCHAISQQFEDENSVLDGVQAMSLSAEQSKGGV